MPPFSAWITFEAATLEEAESIVGTWVISPGAALESLSGTVNSDLAPLVATEGSPLL